MEYVAWSFRDIGVSLSDDVDEAFFLRMFQDERERQDEGCL